MTKKQIIKKQLEELQTQMFLISKSMENTKDSLWVQHGAELHGAALMIDDWLEGIEKEMEVENDDNR